MFAEKSIIQRYCGFAFFVALCIGILACGRTGYRAGGGVSVLPCSDYPRIVDEPGKVGVFNSVVFDQNNIPHIAYYDSSGTQLKYARAVLDPDEGECGWQIEVVDSDGNDTGRYPSIAISPTSGQPRIIYFSYTPGTVPSNLQIRYAQRSVTLDADGDEIDSQWDISPVTENQVTGFATSMALGGDGIYHIATLNMRTQELSYIRFSGSSAITEVVADLRYWSLEDVQTSIAVMASGEPLIVFHHPNNELWAAQRTSAGAWNLTTVERWQYGKDIGRFASVAADSSGGAHVCSFVWAQDQSELWYHHFDGSTWQRDVIDSDSEGIQGASCSITLSGGDELPLISYFNSTNNDLRIAYLRDLGRMRWDTWSADYSMSTGTWSDIAVSGSGGVGVSYYDDSHEGLKFYWIGYY